ncbi:HNH endonuclease [Thermodesulforhabdus norvegica]|uniref:HNH endonuclease n=1 Tax=Thermodesulforhabdus norvegica TaxID=39841 RepID=A0A1I4QLT3_9BACT|nr:HNH endonuclease [Thermodesulforhabdus norvegica]SFM40716.1 HNH endonuclease [Thermodesulforhabdus norvegica]
MEKYFFVVEVSPEFVNREREKAKALKKSRWWQRKISQGICHYCGRSFPPSELTMDHIVPIIRGGRSTRGNIVPACKECNAKKKYLLPLEWDEYLKKLKDDGKE